MKHNFKKIFVLMVSAFTLILTSMVALAADGDTVTIDGIEYTITESDKTASVTDYTGTGGAVVIPSTISYNEDEYSVVEIGSGAFFSNSSITSVVVSEGVTVIDTMAFYKCENIVSISLPDSLIYIIGTAFQSCTSLKSIHIPKNVKHIEGMALTYCPSLEEVTVHEDNMYYTIDEGVLFSKDKTKLILYLGMNDDTSYVVPQSVTRIGASAFADSSLTEIILNEELEYIEDGVFGDYLTSIVIPANTETYYGVFYECDNLKQIIIAEGATSIDDNLIYHCPSIETVIIPASVTSIGDYIFNDYNVSSDIVFHYTGTMEQWATLQNSIGASNDLLVGATPHYISAPVDVEATCTEDGYEDKYVCSTCDEIFYKESYPAINHDYDETKSEANLTRPTSENGEWVDGYYTYTCKNDSNHTKKETVKRADYTGYNEAYTAFGQIINNNDLTEQAIDKITEKVNDIADTYLGGGVLKNNYIETEQHILDDLEESFKDIVEYIEAGIADGSMVAADYSEVEEYIAKLKEEVSKDIYSDVLKEKVVTIETTLEELKEEKPDASIADVKEEFEDIFLEIEELSVTTEKVKVVADKIEALSDALTLDDATSVETAKNAYNSLSDYEKSLLAASVKIEMDSAIAKIEELTEQNTTDGEKETTTSNQNNEKETTTGNGGTGDVNPSTGDATSLFWIVGILLISSMVIVAMNSKKIEE